MSIEGGARSGYVNPDQTTFDYLKGRDYCPEGEAWERAVADWQSLASDADAEYDDVIEIKGEDIEPFVTWGITCLLYTSPSPRDATLSRMPSSA